MTCLLFFFLSTTVKGGQKNTGDLTELLTADSPPPSPESEHQADGPADDAVVPVTAEETRKFIQFLTAEHALPASLLPDGIEKVEGDTEKMNGLQVARGTPAGVAQQVQGTVWVVHKGGTKAYRLQEHYHVVAGDTLITEQDSRVNLLMHDKSMLTLTAQSKLVVEKFLYSRKLGTRDTKLRLIFGKVRAAVSKIPSGEPNYRVKTPTAVVGVRGTDFVVAVTPIISRQLKAMCLFIPRGSTSRHILLSSYRLMTAVVTGGGDSTVEFRGTTGPAQLVGPGSMSTAVPGKKLNLPIHIGPAAVEFMDNIAPLSCRPCVCPLD
ncbi:MAG: FecR domain-containing protein [Candidatus Electrothrix sp. YB6]